MNRKQKLKGIEEQMGYLMTAMNSVPLDSAEYKELQARYNEFVKMEEEIKNNKKGWNVFLDISKLLISLLGAVATPLFLAKVAYDGEQEMKLVNNKIWNQIGKRYDKT